MLTFCAASKSGLPRPDWAFCDFQLRRLPASGWQTDSQSQSAPCRIRPMRASSRFISSAFSRRPFQSRRRVIADLGHFQIRDHVGHGTEPACRNRGNVSGTAKLFGLAVRVRHFMGQPSLHKGGRARNSTTKFAASVKQAKFSLQAAVIVERWGIVATLLPCMLACGQVSRILRGPGSLSVSRRRVAGRQVRDSPSAAIRISPFSRSGFGEAGTVRP